MQTSLAALTSGSETGNTEATFPLCVSRWTNKCNITALISTSGSACAACSDAGATTRPGSTGVHKHALHPPKKCLHPQLKKKYIYMIKIIKYLLTKQIVMKLVTISIKYRWDMSIQHHSDRSVVIYFCCRKQFHSFIWLKRQTNHNLLSIIIINSTFY